MLGCAVVHLAANLVVTDLAAKMRGLTHQRSRGERADQRRHRQALRHSLAPQMGCREAGGGDHPRRQRDRERLASRLLMALDRRSPPCVRPASEPCASRRSPYTLSPGSAVVPSWQPSFWRIYSRRRAEEMGTVFCSRASICGRRPETNAVAGTV